MLWQAANYMRGASQGVGLISRLQTGGGIAAEVLRFTCVCVWVSAFLSSRMFKLTLACSIVSGSASA